MYTLWHNPGIVPLLHTPSIVVQKLQGGADLMTPGLAHGPPFPAKAVKGAIAAIASIESPTVPLAVGVCEIDISSLQKTQGAKGRAVQTVHWQGDELWAWSSSGKSGGSAPEHLEGWSAGERENKTLETQMDKMTVEDEELAGGVSLTDKNSLSETRELPGDENAHTRPDKGAPAHIKESPEGEEEEHVTEMTTKGMVKVSKLLSSC